jgi:hypothetical protein
VAVVVSVYIRNSIAHMRSGTQTQFVSFGNISFQDSLVVMTRSRLTNCTAESNIDSSFGTSSVYGGALAIIHSPQVSKFRFSLLVPWFESHASGNNLSVLVSKSYFSACSVVSHAFSVRPGQSNGGGGAIYVNSVALTNLSLTDSTFNSSRSTVSGGSTGFQSYSCGGALHVYASISNWTVVAISSCSFFNCTAQGANIINLNVRGGAVSIFRAAHISVTRTNFTNCSLMDAVKSDNFASGGSAMSAFVSSSMSIGECVFDARGGADSSQQSTGLLILASNSTIARVIVSNCVFNASAVVINFRCATDDGVRFAGSCIAPTLLLSYSHIFQAPTAIVTYFNFDAIGSNLISVQNPNSVSFTGSSMSCATPMFAVFKRELVESSTSSTVYSCTPCQTFSISLTDNAVLLEDLMNVANVDRCFPVSTDRTNFCPFAVEDCTTSVNVLNGFWTYFELIESKTLVRALRCPRGYCGCSNMIDGYKCPLPPPISINPKPDPLCNGNRTGKLCGGCIAGFSHSMDDRTCISNEDCAENLWWVWTLLMLGYVVFGLYIVVSCRKRSDGAFSCLLFYFQMSSFATSANESGAMVNIVGFSQMRSIFIEFACYAPSMSAYNATAFKLIDPLFVLVFAFAWTWIIQKLQPWLQQRNVDMTVSYSGTLAVTLLFAFSKVANVVFTLLECTGYSDSEVVNDVVFIDGTVPCRDTTWNCLVFVAVLLFLFPAAFAAALRLKNFPQSARDAVCGKFTGPMFYWGAVTLLFRLLISFSLFLRVSFPNLMSAARSFLSVGMLVVLVHARPYISSQAFWVDVACYVCLTAQFILLIIAGDREYIAVGVLDSQNTFFNNVSTSSAVIR